MTTAPFGEAQRAALRGRAAPAALLALVVVGLVVVLLWRFTARDEPAGPQDDDRAASPSTLPIDPPATPSFGGPPTDSNGSTPPGSPTPLSPIERIRAEAPAGWRDLHGLAVRAADSSPLAGVTVVAVPARMPSSADPAALQAVTGEDGDFTLRVPDGDLNFRVLLPHSDTPHEQAAEDGRVGVRLRWGDDDPQGSDIQLVVESGWRLDVQVIDGEARPHEGVLVKAAGRSARSDRRGRCALLDLPLAGADTTLTLQADPGSKAITWIVHAPEPGQLVKEELIKVP